MAVKSIVFNNPATVTLKEIHDKIMSTRVGKLYPLGANVENTMIADDKTTFADVKEGDDYYLIITPKDGKGDKWKKKNFKQLKTEIKEGVAVYAQRFFNNENIKPDDFQIGYEKTLFKKNKLEFWIPISVKAGTVDTVVKESSEDFVNAVVKNDNTAINILESLLNKKMEERINSILG